jgi:hypothetical protein
MSVGKDVLKPIAVLLIALQLTIILAVAAPAQAWDDVPLPPPSVFLLATPQGEDILVTWTAVPQDGMFGTSALNLTRAAADGSGAVSIAWLPADSTAFLDQDVEPGVSYRYRLLIVHEVDHPAYDHWSSSEMSIRTDAVAPGAPRDLHAEAGGSQVNLTWVPPADDGGGSIYNYTVCVGDSGDDLRPLMNVRSFDFNLMGGCTVPNLTNGHQYFFAVRAVNSVGPSALSDAVSILPLDAPVMTVSCQDLGDGDFDISLQWEPPAPGEVALIGYELHVESVGVNHTVLSFGPDECSYTYELRGAFGECLVFRVRAVYADNASSFSNSEELQFGMYEEWVDWDRYLLSGAVMTVLVMAGALTWGVHRRRRG